MKWLDRWPRIQRQPRQDLRRSPLQFVPLLRLIEWRAVKWGRKRAGEKKLWESLSLLGHKWMNNVSAVSTNIRCTTNWNNRIAKAKPKRPLTNAMRFLECGHETICSLKRQPTTKATTLKWNSTHPGVYEEIYNLIGANRSLRQNFDY